MSRFEVEMKFRGADPDLLKRRLVDLDAEAGAPVEQEDDYLAHPDRDFRQTDEALRLRRHGMENRVTYKGPKLAGPTKTREEVEIPFASGPEPLEQMRRLFTNLGFRPVASVRKVRAPYRLTFEGRDVEIGLDEVEGLGPFAEVEVMASGPADLAEAQRVVLALAAELGLSEEQVERRSYLRMILEGEAG